MIDWPPSVARGAQRSGCIAAHHSTATVLPACGDEGSEKALRSRPVNVARTSSARPSFSGGAESSCSTSSSTSSIGGGGLALEDPQAVPSALSHPASAGASSAPLGTGGMTAAGNDVEADSDSRITSVRRMPSTARDGVSPKETSWWNPARST